MISQDDEIAQTTRVQPVMPIVDPKPVAWASPGTTSASVEDLAGRLYYICAEVVVTPNGDQWDVLDGALGPRIGTVDTAVLIELDDNYDLPVRALDGSEWDPRRR